MPSLIKMEIEFGKEYSMKKYSFETVWKNGVRKNTPCQIQFGNIQIGPEKQSIICVFVCETLSFVCLSFACYFVSLFLS